MAHLYIDGTTAAGLDAVLQLLAAVEAVEDSVTTAADVAERAGDG
jgi:hypothetical protein